MRNLKLIIFSAVAVSAIVGTSVASAADMAARPYTKAPTAPVMTYNWTGCYVGGNLGGGWSSISQTKTGRIDGVPSPTADYGNRDSDGAFIGGAQVGCDYQFAGNWVVGVQGMFDFGNVNSSHTLPAFPTFYSQDRVRDVFTVTGRVGYLFTPALLGYVKGGGAFARVNSSVFGTGPLFLSETANGQNRSGYTVGGGLEWMFAPGWSVFGEFNYMDFGRRDVSYVSAVPGSANPGDVVSTKLEVEQVLVGVNYKFNWGGPVVAKN
jgi:outer membrane immunogenic protein